MHFFITYTCMLWFDFMLNLIFTYIRFIRMGFLLALPVPSMAGDRWEHPSHFPLPLLPIPILQQVVYWASSGREGGSRRFIYCLHGHASHFVKFFHSVNEIFMKCKTCMSLIILQAGSRADAGNELCELSMVLRVSCGLHVNIHKNI